MKRIVLSFFVVFVVIALCIMGITIYIMDQKIDAIYGDLHEILLEYETSDNIATQQDITKLKDLLTSNYSLVINHDYAIKKLEKDITDINNNIYFIQDDIRKIKNRLR